MNQKQRKVCWSKNGKFLRMLRTLVVIQTTDVANAEAEKFAKKLQRMKS